MQPNLLIGVRSVYGNVTTKGPSKALKWHEYDLMFLCNSKKMHANRFVYISTNFMPPLATQVLYIFSLTQVGRT